MKMTTDKRDVSAFGTSGTKAFTIAGSAKAFKILSDGLYSDKITAVIRELSCNAYDSHVEAGKADVPFEVHLPNRLEPWFAVTDFGIGLCHDDIVNLYSTYFESTKTDSNDVTGCLGLGSKSPFAYVDAFTVEGRWNGKLTTYSCFYDDDGIPTITVMGEAQDTDQPNGLTIKMPVKEGDFYEFGQKARKALNRFNPTPVVTGATDWEIDTVEYSMEGTDWKLHKMSGSYYRGNVYAIQGNVTYPISEDSIPGKTDAQRAVLSLPLDLFFDIGDLDITPSRESLGYNEATIANIKAKLDIVANELPPMFQDRFNECKTLWEARKLFRTMIRDLPSGVRSLLSDKDIGLKWKNQALDEEFSFKTEDFSAPIMMFERGRSRGNAVDPNYQGQFRFEASENVTFFYDDLGRGAHSRMVHFAETSESATKKNFLIKTNEKKALKTFSKLLGNVTLQPVSNLPKRPKAERAAAKVSSKVLEYIGKAYDRRDSWNPTEVNLKDGEGVYVTINRFKVFDGEREVSDFDDIVELAKTHDLLDLDDKPIYGIRSGDVAKLPDDTKWVELFSLIRDNISKVVAKEKIASILADYNEFRDFSFDLSSFASELMAETFEKGSAMADFIEAYTYMEKRHSDRATEIRNIANRVGYNIDTTSPKYDLSDLWEKVTETYPLISMLDSHAMRGGYYSYSEGNKDRRKKNFANLMAYIRMVDANEDATDDGEDS